MRGSLARAAALGVPIAAGLLPLLVLGALPKAPQAIALDGVRDAEYVLLAVDAPDDLASGLAALTTWQWAELSALYVATDTTTLYVFVDLPLYAQGDSTGQIGLAIDTTGDVAGSGGEHDPWGNAITYAYTTTHNMSGSTPVTTSHVIWPDVVIRGWLQGAGGNDDGSTDLLTWDGSGWTGAGNNWGGIMGSAQVGARIAYADGSGVELAIPLADLGVPPTATLHMQFYVGGSGIFNGVYDSLPSDAQASGPGQATVLSHLTTVAGGAGEPPTPVPPCSGAAVGDGVIAAAGLYHTDADLAYRDPLGSVAIGAAADLRLRTCAGDVSGAAVLVWQTGEALTADPDVYLMAPVTSGADYTTWAASVPAPGALTDQWYQFRLTDGGATGYYRPAAGNHGPGSWSATLGQPTWKLGTLPAPAAGYVVPGWLKDAVIYQIVLDRFRNGDAANDPPAGQSAYGPATCGGGPCTTTLHAGWNEAPATPADGVDFFGGDLQGVLDKLQEGYFDDLGVNTLLLSPPFESSSNHGRDTNDYYAIAARYGTSATLAALIGAAQARGIRVMLEAELNYAGADSRYVDGYGADRWPGALGACEADDSAYRPWFIPGGSGAGDCHGGWGWQGWLGNEALAVFAEVDPLRAFFYRGGSPESPDGRAVTEYWQALGLAGWRFNRADGLSHAWFDDMRPYLKALGAETVVMGEVTTGCDADLFVSYLNAAELDALTNYCLPDWAIDLAGGGNPSAFAASLGDLQALLPPQPFNGLMNPLSGPTSPRALTLLGGDKARLRLAALVQMTLPGAPAVYYGDEAGVEGGNEPDNRRTYPWSDQGGTPDAALYAYLKHLIGLRRAHGALRGTGLQVLLADDGQRLLSFVRSDGAQTAVVVVNAGPGGQTANVPVMGHLANGTVLTDVLNLGGRYTVTNGALSVPVAGLAGAVLVGEAAGVLPPVVALASGAISVTEGAGTVAVAVEVTGSQTRTISVTYSTAPGTAGVGDYIDTGGVLAFAPGQTSRTFFVTLVNDEVEEEVETFTVQLSQAVNGVIGSPGAATVSIIDDDTPAWRAYLPAIHR